MSNYCFAEPEGRRALFEEVYARGWVSAVQDFPQRKNIEECTAQAMRECEMLQSSEVCCITDLAAYRQLVCSTWVNVYLSLEQAPERMIVHFASVLKHRPLDDALNLVRPSFARGEVQTEIDNAYAQFLESTQSR